ncbi:AraC family transcriptional regulator [Planctomonas sp. JC2975]|uniref:AraC family transcriptional regulator n=1 Tax=Planctomonas sp. JC2975 TaxID=2729626 RepID=UPI00147625DC|nr:helix-turn-helix domain-containing protein [Planctomonas sp. JC2975]NNC12405.1 AraC family transcriptional regulator [Planctomonas sp. JC2975]
MTDAAPQSRGHLNPGDPRVVFDRFVLGAHLRDVVRHVWVVRWDAPDGTELAQRVLTYPAFNAVFEAGGTSSGDAEARLYPPTGRVDVRRLSGTGWGVGILLRPCAAHLMLTGGDTRIDVHGVPREGLLLEDAPVAAVSDVLLRAGELPEGLGLDGREQLGDILRSWLTPHARRVDDRDRLVNEACRIAEEDASVQRASELASRLGLAPRTLERLMRDYLGLGPKWLIECRRMQEAATTLYAHPETDLSTLAADLGYADYAHFSRRYRSVLGETPNRTRAAASADLQ